MAVKNKKAVAEFLLIAEKSRDASLDAERKVRSLKMEFSLLKHRRASFDGTMIAADKELPRLEWNMRLYGET